MQLMRGDDGKFRSLPRSQRRAILKRLESAMSIEDIRRRRGEWVKAFHSLHVGDYSSRFPRTYAFAIMARTNNIPMDLDVEADIAMRDGDWHKAVSYLVNRPDLYLLRFNRLRSGNHELAVRGLRVAIKNM